VVFVELEALELEEDFAEGDHGRFFADVADVGAGVAFETSCDVVEVYLGRGAIAEVMNDHVLAGLLVRHIDEDLSKSVLTLFSSLRSMASSRSQGMLLAASTNTFSPFLSNPSI
jgi:hypothetical protein